MKEKTPVYTHKTKNNENVNGFFLFQRLVNQLKKRKKNQINYQREREILWEKIFDEMK